MYRTTKSVAWRVFTRLAVQPRTGMGPGANGVAGTAAIDLPAALHPPPPLAKVSRGLSHTATHERIRTP